MARLAEALDVAVVVAAALGERHDMVGHRRRHHDAALGATTAQRFGGETAPTLRLAGAAAEALPHRYFWA